MAYSPVLNPQPVTPDSVLDSLTTTASVSSQTTVMSVSNAGFNGGSFHITSAGSSNLISFEHSNDNTNWVTLYVSNNNSAYSTLGVNIGSTGMFFYSSSAAYVRARVNTYTAGTVTISLTQKRNATSITPISLSTPLAGTNIGTVTVTGGGTAINVSPDNILDNLTTTGSATANLVTIVSVSTAGFNGGSFQVTSAGVATVSYEQSNDNINWVAMNLRDSAATSNNAVSTSTTAIILSYTSSAAFVRARTTAYTSGTVSITLIQKRNAAPVTALSLSASTAPIGNVTVASGTFVALSAPVTITDVTSAALTSTTTTAVFQPTYGCSYEVNIPVTVVSGTAPTLDVVIQESDDSGTNWFDVYHFPRITAVGMYRSPKLPLIGSRVRYVQTVAGTTPSFTRAINRLQSSDRAMPYRRIIDRTLASTQALNNITSTMTVLAASPNLQLTIATTLVTTTAPALQLQGSEDGGVTWYSLGSPLTAVTAATVQTTVNNVNAELVRAIVTTAGVSTTLNYVAIKAF
jgi:hypothetical protein